MKPDPRVSFARFTPGEPPSPSALHQSSCRPASQPSSGFLRSFALLHSQTAPPPPANHVPDCCVYALRCAALRYAVWHGALLRFHTSFIASFVWPRRRRCFPSDPPIPLPASHFFFSPFFSAALLPVSVSPSCHSSLSNSQIFTSFPSPLPLLFFFC